MNEKLYKLTTQDYKSRAGTYNETLWGPGVTHKGTGKGPLCSAAYIHAYTHPLLAVVMNPIHAAIGNPVLWECEGTVAASDHGLKVGCPELTTTRIIPLPVIRQEQLIAAGILHANAVRKDDRFQRWASAWMDGTDRSTDTARDTLEYVASTRLVGEKPAYWALLAAKWNEWDEWAAEVSTSVATAVELSVREADVDSIELITQAMQIRRSGA